MDTIISWLFKAVIASGILVCYYWIALRNRKFHHYNRFYLLLATGISLVFPLLHFRLYHVVQPAYKPVSGLLSIIDAGDYSQTDLPFSWQPLVLACAALVSAALLVILLVKIIWIYRVRGRYTAVKMNGFYLIETELKQAPFSFFNNLFWRKSISIEDENGGKIFRHELAHIREKHTYDKLFSQLVVCILWMNPFFWIIQKELNLIHEFIADEKSVNDGDTLSFAQMLLRAHNEGRYLDPSHPFFNSSIKRRLIMITTSKKTPFSYLRRILVLPLVCALFSITIARAQNNPSKPDSANARMQKEKAEQKEMERKERAEQKEQEQKEKVEQKEKEQKEKAEQKEQEQKEKAEQKEMEQREKAEQKEQEEKAAYDKLTPEQKEALQQQREAAMKEISKRKAGAILKDLPPAVYLINGVETSRETVLKLDPAKVKRVSTLYIGGNKHEDEEHAQSPWGKEVIAKYGEKAKSGVIEFITE